MGIKTADVLLVGVGQSFLGLDHLDVVGDAGGETILGLNKGLLRIIQGRARYLNLFAGGGNVENGVGNILLNAALQIVALRLALRQDRVGLTNVSLDLAALEDGDSQAGIDGPGGKSIVGTGSEDAVVATDADGGQTLGFG